MINTLCVTYLFKFFFIFFQIKQTVKRWTRKPKVCLFFFATEGVGLCLKHLHYQKKAHNVYPEEVDYHSTTSGKDIGWKTATGLGMMPMSNSSAKGHILQ